MFGLLLYLRCGKIILSYFCLHADHFTRTPTSLQRGLQPDSPTTYCMFYTANSIKGAATGVLYEQLAKKHKEEPHLPAKK